MTQFINFFGGKIFVGEFDGSGVMMNEMPCLHLSDKFLTKISQITILLSRSVTTQTEKAEAARNVMLSKE